MFKKITKLLLAASLVFSYMVCLNMNNTKVNASEIQPRAQIINREINDEVFVRITDGDTWEYARVVVMGTYTHNKNGSSEWPTNISIRVVLGRSYESSSMDSELGTFDIELSNIRYSCSNNRLVINCDISAETFGNYYSNPVTIRI